MELNSNSTISNNTLSASGGSVRVVSTGHGLTSSSATTAKAVAVTVSVSSDSNSPGAVAKSPNGVSGEEDNGVIAAPASLNTSSDSGAPAEIPPEPSPEGPAGDREQEEEDMHPEEEEDDESEYEYEDDEDAAFPGFLVDHPPLAAAAQTTTTADQSSTQEGENSTENPARIRDEEESVSNAAAAENARKAKWREPSREAVSMSLRAEREKTGSKRRLAQDLYRIMNQETEEAGFSIAPKSEDNMDHWIIKLFMFDPDSNLAKDMVVLGFEHIELEMTFPDQYPFEPPFVRVVRPRFKRQTGFVMNGALCMELLTKVGGLLMFVFE